MEQHQREALVAALAALSEEDRRTVLRDARSRATASVTMPWNELRKAIAIVHGAPADAIIDTEHLYDD